MALTLTLTSTLTRARTLSPHPRSNPTPIPTRNPHPNPNPYSKGPTQSRLVIEADLWRRDGGKFLWRVARVGANAGANSPPRRGGAGGGSRGEAGSDALEVVLKYGVSGGDGWDESEALYKLRTMIEADGLFEGRRASTQARKHASTHTK